MTGEALLTVNDVCRFLQVGRTTFYRLVSRHGLPVLRVGGSLRVDPALLRAWIDAQEASVRPPNESGPATEG